MDTKITTSLNNEQSTMAFESSRTAQSDDVPGTDSTLTTTITRDRNDDDNMKKTASSLSKPSIICRICLTSGEWERLITPCDCKGTHAFVHRECLENWLSRSGLSHCELCLFHFHTANYLRYGMCESMRIWFSHPSNRALLMSDILLCTLLTVITFGLVVIAMFGMYYVTASSSSSLNIHNEVTKYWTETSIGVFLAIVVFAFILNVAIVVKANFVPWFRWWRRCKEIQLVIEDSNHSGNTNNNNHYGARENV